MKKVGIVVDNFKVKTFVEALEKNNFVIKSQGPLTAGTTAITLMVFPDEVDTIRKICTTLQIEFNQSN